MEYKGKEVKLNKPSRGDVKKFKVFVKDPKTGNVKKVNFGDPNMEIKRDNPERRKSFRARHKCDTAKDRTKPRYWSCKFWSKNKVSDILKEIIDPEAIDVSKLKLNDRLSDEIWNDGGKLKPEVRKKLLMNAKRFIEFSDAEDYKFLDITLTGSMANYNYNENSDLDVHIVLNFDQFSEDIELLKDFFMLKKQMWADKLPVQIKGHDVELYFQDSEEPHHSTGIYSLLYDKWITKPQKKIINIDTNNVKSKSAEIMNIIDKLEKQKDDGDFLDKHSKLKDKLKKYRQSGLDKNGEFSVENLVFKILRNNGYLQKLTDMKNEFLSNELSLDEMFK